MPRISSDTSAQSAFSMRFEAKASACMGRELIECDYELIGNSRIPILYFIPSFLAFPSKVVVHARTSAHFSH